MSFFNLLLQFVNQSDSSFSLMRVIMDNKELQGVKGVCKGSRASQENTTGYYTYMEGYSWLKGAITSGYRVTRNYRLVLFILELFSFILHFIYKTFNVSIFLFYRKQLLNIDKILISQLWYTRWWNNCQMKEFKEYGITWWNF